MLEGSQRDADEQVAKITDRISQVRAEMAAMEAERNTAVSHIADLRVLAAAAEGDREKKLQDIELIRQDTLRLQEQIAALQAYTGVLREGYTVLRQGISTVEHIKNVADGYYGGETDIIERYADYTIVVKFTSSYGIPSNLADLQAVLREIVPAHLAIEYEFKFVTYDVLKTAYGTYDDVLLSEHTYDGIRDGGV